MSADLGAHWILKGYPNQAFSYNIDIKSSKKGLQEGVLKNMTLGLVFDAKKRGLEKQKKTFRIIVVVIVVVIKEVSLDHEI